MEWTSRRQRFRAVLGGERCIHPASVHDPVSARLATDLGFETAILAGSVASLAVLGAPDLIVLTLTEFAEQALRINRAGAPPLLVDADHGYGNALSVMRTVQELETAGVAALSIEDTLLPAPYGGGPARLISLEEGVGKMKAAIAAREDPGLVIFARTSALAISGLNDAVSRVRAFSGLGVDGIFLIGAKTRAEIEAMRAVTDLPFVLGGTGGELADTEWLAAHGVRLALQGHQPFQAAIAALHATMKALRDGTKPSELQGLASAALAKQVTRESDYARWTTDFLGGG
ncbi:isocitrate lyase/PEP mutase family protein [Roseomonas sp. SSH11]|uniref:Isocitrate lyase/PEP mutase family protein n=1 Tax=Pararoseomonas baculiformis TaxID=2820812 RepID=A0ABS4AFW8_9PROT|nr:isocitrate lyase/PEP mutase family protein [Pararoseomonas baculiformis]MBP0445893.1 isocitrate lyase/PEP mutase family protein [Pararoseomonas baculiformis]